MKRFDNHMTFPIIDIYDSTAGERHHARHQGTQTGRFSRKSRFGGKVIVLVALWDVR
jgi:hypothetical protein